MAAAQTGNTPAPGIVAICNWIETAASSHGLPQYFLARLIWKESRFDHLALSPAGAQGIAQFMPATASERGLSDPWDPEPAIEASAALLADLRDRYGNLGLAAAAYNAGEGAVDRWIAGKRYLPLETEGYVLDILGEPASVFMDRGRLAKNRVLDAAIPFRDACEKLPVMRTRVEAMAGVTRKPWGIQIAGNFREAVVRRSVDRLKRRVALLKDHDIFIQRKRSPMARRMIHAARIGAESRREADRICAALRGSGAACVVSKN